MKTDYYADLLIKQYRDKPKARATINGYVEIMPMDALNEMNDAYELEKSIGKQLSILARWVGVNRNYPSPRYKSGTYFAQPYIRENSIESTDVLQSGFQQFNNPQPWNGPFLTTDDIVFDDNKIGDDDLKVLVKLKIIKNNVRATQGKIDNAIFEVFGTDIYTTWPEAKVLVYNCKSQYTTAITIGKVNNWLPRPTDCRILIKEI